MAEQEDQPRKIIKIKRIKPSETQDSNTANTTLSPLEEGTLEVCKAYVPAQSVQVFCI